MLRVFAKHSLIYGLGNILTRGINFFLLPIYTRALDPSQYGTYDLLLLYVNIVNVCVAFEISQSVARFFPDTKDEEEKNRITSTAFLFTFATYAIYSVLSLLLFEQLNLVFFEGRISKDIFQLAILFNLANGLFLFSQAQLRNSLKSKEHSIVSLVVAIASSAFSIVAILILHWGVAGLLIGQTIGSSLGAILSVYFDKKNYRLQFDFLELKKMIRFSAPLVPASISFFLSNYIDRFLINRYLNLEQVGIYGAGFRLASILSIALFAVSSALTPLTYSSYRDSNFSTNLDRLLRLLSVPTLIFVVCLTFAGKEVFGIMVGEKFGSAYEVAPVLALSILIGRLYIFTPGLPIAKKTGSIFFITIISFIVSATVSWLSLLHFGLAGAAIANLVSSIATFILFFRMGQKHYFVQFHWLRLGLAYSGVTLAALFTPMWGPLSFLFRACILTSMIFAIVFSLMSLSEIRNFLTKTLSMVFSVRTPRV